MKISRRWHGGLWRQDNICLDKLYMNGLYFLTSVSCCMTSGVFMVDSMECGICSIESDLLLVIVLLYTNGYEY